MSSSPSQPKPRASSNTAPRHSHSTLVILNLARQADSVCSPLIFSVCTTSQGSANPGCSDLISVTWPICLISQNSTQILFPTKVWTHHTSKSMYDGISCSYLIIYKQYNLAPQEAFLCIVLVVVGMTRLEDHLDSWKTELWTLIGHDLSASLENRFTALPTQLHSFSRLACACDCQGESEQS